MMSEDNSESGATQGIEASERVPKGAEINELLSHIAVNLDLGLSTLRGEGAQGVEDREAVCIGLERAREDIFAIAELIREASVFWNHGEEKKEEELLTETLDCDDEKASLEEKKSDELEVLLIDDEFRMGRVFERILRGRANVMMATAVNEAWRLLDAQAFDVIFCDVHLPGVSGADFFRELTKRDPDQADRVVFITGGLYSDESQQLIEEVDNPVVYKPFDFAAIENALEKVLEE